MTNAKSKTAHEIADAADKHAAKDLADKKRRLDEAQDTLDKMGKAHEDGPTPYRPEDVTAISLKVTEKLAAALAQYGDQLTGEDKENLRILTVMQVAKWHIPNSR